jgi:hypothetical protein
MLGSRALAASAAVSLAAAVLLSVISGCGGSAAVSAEPEAKQRLTGLFQLYKFYCEKNKKAPANEQALRDFAKTLTPEERTSRKIGDDLEGIFVSPRDGEKFVIRYNLMVTGGGSSKGVAWEAKGKDGRRFVALLMGYVEEYSEPMFLEATK